MSVTAESVQVITDKPITIGIVAGEASGDILGAGLIKALKAYFPNATFEGVGGTKMQAEGFHSLYEMDRLSVMGIVEPLKRLPELLRMRKSLINYFKARKPAFFIGIDSPDFNLNIERDLKQSGILTCHYVSPSVWAWRQKRIIKIKQSVDLMLTLLPFEASFYKEHQVKVEFVGHPLADQFPLENNLPENRNKLAELINLPEFKTDNPVVALMPGSRSGEVKLLVEPFLQAAKICLQHNPNLQFVIPAANKDRKMQILAAISQVPELVLDQSVFITDGESHTAMAGSNAVLMASGTTTLEALLLKKPMVVAYKMAPMSYKLISRMLHTKFISLPNLLANKALVPEILQEEATPDRLSRALLSYLNDESKCNELVDEFTQIHHTIKRDADQIAAKALADLYQIASHKGSN